MLFLMKTYSLIKTDEFYFGDYARLQSNQRLLKVKCLQFTYRNFLMRLKSNILILVLKDVDQSPHLFSLLSWMPKRNYRIACTSAQRMQS